MQPMQNIKRYWNRSLAENKDLALESIQAHIIQSRDAVKKITLEMLAQFISWSVFFY